MSQTREWGIGQPAGLYGVSVADRMLQALESDYLYTLQAGERQRQSPAEEQPQLSQCRSTRDYEHSRVSPDDGEPRCDLTNTSTEAIKYENTALARTYAEEGILQTGLLVTPGSDLAGQGELDSSAESVALFAYERLSSTEGPPLYSLSDENSGCTQRCTPIRDGHREHGDSPEARNEASGNSDHTVEVSTGASSSREAAVVNSSGVMAEPQPPAPAEAESLQPQEERHLVVATGKGENRQWQTHSVPHAPGVEQRPAVRGDMPLDPQSVVFIIDVMRGLSVRDPRGEAGPKPRDSGTGYQGSTPS